MYNVTERPSLQGAPAQESSAAGNVLESGLFELKLMISSFQQLLIPVTFQWLHKQNRSVYFILKVCSLRHVYTMGCHWEHNFDMKYTLSFLLCAAAHSSSCSFQWIQWLHTAKTEVCISQSMFPVTCLHHGMSLGAYFLGMKYTLPLLIN